MDSAKEICDEIDYLRERLQTLAWDIRDLEDREKEDSECSDCQEYEKESLQQEDRIDKLLDILIKNGLICPLCCEEEELGPDKIEAKCGCCYHPSCWEEISKCPNCQACSHHSEFLNNRHYCGKCETEFPKPS